MTVVMLVSLCSVFTVSAAADAQVATVTLASGDSVLKICQAHGIDYYTYKDLIMKLNGITDESQFSKLPVGKQIVLPISNAAAAALSGSTATVSGATGAGTTGTGLTSGTVSSLPSGDRVAYYLVTYKVQRGDTIGSIYSAMGLSYKTYENQVVKLNKLRNVNAIQAGQTLTLPTTNPGLSGTTYTTIMAHTMRSGESAYDIVCGSYGLSYNSAQAMLQALNNRDNLGLFRVGETMYIPVAGLVSASTTVPGGTTGGSTTTGTVSSGVNYNLVKQTPVNGSFDLQVGGKSVGTASAGQLVSVVCTPDTGYAVDTIKVVKVGDASTGVAVNSSSFVMPSYAVTVSVTFKQAVQSDIIVSSPVNGSVSAMVDGSIVTKAYAGAQITVKTTPAAGFMLDYVRVTYNENRDSIAVENGKFTMPNFPVTVTAVFKIDPDYNPTKGNSIFVDVQNAKVVAKVGTNAVTAAKEGDRVTLEVTPDANYTLESIRVYYDNFTKTANLEKMSFTMPNMPVTIVATVKPTSQATFEIKKIQNTDGTFVTKVDDKEVTSAKAGDTVQVVGGSTKAFYNYIPYVTKTGDSSVVVYVDKDTNTFTMPDYPVTVKVQFYVYHNVVLDASNGTNGFYNVTAVINGMQVQRCGAGVELQVNIWGVTNGMSAGDIILTYQDGSTYTLVNTNRFIMPDCNVRVRVEFKNNMKLTANAALDYADGKETRSNWGNSYTILGKTFNDEKNCKSAELYAGEGNNIIITPNCAIGYTVREMYYTLNDVKTPIGYSETYSRWQFPMPKLGKGDKLQVFVVFEKIPSYEIKLVSNDASVIVLDDNKTVVESATKKTMGRIDLMTSLGYTDHVAENSMVWVRFFPADGYQLDVTKIKISYTDKDGNVRKVTYNSYDSTFKMPAADVTIDVSDCFAQTKHTIAVRDNWFEDGSKIDLQVGIGDKIYKDYVRSADDTKSIVTDTSGSPMRFESGKVITVVHETRNGYYPDIIVESANPPKTEYPVTHIGDGLFSFVMPLEDVIIIPTTKNDFYNIVAVESANGSFKVPAQAAWGQDVSITEITSADGYEVGEVSITYTDASSVEIKKVIEADADGNYSFNLDAMPLSDVKVEVKFVASSNNLNIVYHIEGIPSASNFYRVDISVGEKKMDIQRDAFTKTFDDGVCPGDTVIGGAKTGDLITITPSTAGADDRYEISTVWVLNNGVALEEKPEYSYNQYYFTMPYVEPGKTCEIHIKYALKDETKYVLDLDVTGADAAASTLNGTSFADLGTATVKIGVGSVVEVVVIPDKLHEQASEARVIFTDNEGKDVNKPVENVSTRAEDGAKVFTFGNKDNQPAINASPKGAVKFKLVLEGEEKTLSCKPDGYLTFALASDPATPITTARVDQKVVATVMSNPGWSVTKLTMTVDGKPVEPAPVLTDGKYEFTMPGGNVEFTVEDAKDPSLTNTDITGNLTLKVDGTEIKASDYDSDRKVSVKVGSIVEAVPAAVEGYEVDYIAWTDGTGTETKITPADGKYTFEMPDSDVTVRMEYKVATPSVAGDPIPVSCTTTGASGSDIRILPLVGGAAVSQVSKGQTIVISGSAYDCTIKSVVWKLGETGTENVVSLDSAGVYKFDAPEKKSADDILMIKVELERNTHKIVTKSGKPLGDYGTFTATEAATGDDIIVTPPEGYFYSKFKVSYDYMDFKTGKECALPSGMTETRVINREGARRISLYSNYPIAMGENIVLDIELKPVSEANNEVFVYTNNWGYHFSTEPTYTISVNGDSSKKYAVAGDAITIKPNFSELSIVDKVGGLISVGGELKFIDDIKFDSLKGIWNIKLNDEPDIGTGISITFNLKVGASSYSSGTSTDSANSVVMLPAADASVPGESAGGLSIE